MSSRSATSKHAVYQSFFIQLKNCYIFLSRHDVVLFCDSYRIIHMACRFLHWVGCRSLLDKYESTNTFYKHFQWFRQFEILFSDTDSVRIYPQHEFDSLRFKAWKHTHEELPRHKSTQYISDFFRLDQSLSEMYNIFFCSQVKVIDFGSSCFLDDHLSSYVQSRSYRAYIFF